MTDPQPEVPSGLPPAPNESDQSFLADQPHVSPSDLPKVLPIRPPLAELNVNGEPLPTQPAAPMKAHTRHPSPVAPSRLIKKKKTATKLHPFHPLSQDETVKQKLKEGRDIPAPSGGIPAVVQPLQAIDADDVSIADEEDDFWSEDEEDFDIEEFLLDDEKKAELRCLMERYEVYDEEQLRLAIRRKRLLGKSAQPIAGNSPPSPDSAPASPSHYPSRFIPPPTSKSLPYIGEIPSQNHAQITPKSRLTI